MSLITSIEKRLEKVEFWQKVQLALLCAIAGEKALEIISKII